MPNQEIIPANPSGRKAYVHFGQEQKDRFLQLLQSGHNVKRAAELIGIHSGTAYYHRGIDEDFAGQWDYSVSLATKNRETESLRKVDAHIDVMLEQNAVYARDDDGNLEYDEEGEPILVGTDLKPRDAAALRSSFKRAVDQPLVNITIKQDAEKRLEIIQDAVVWDVDPEPDPFDM